MNIFIPRLHEIKLGILAFLRLFIVVILLLAYLKQFLLKTSRSRFGIHNVFIC